MNLSIILFSLSVSNQAHAQSQPSASPTLRSVVADTDGDGWVETYDARGSLMEQTWRDSAGLLTNHPDLGYARETMAYDWRGNLTTVAYYDVDSVLVADSMGVALSRVRYDSENRPVEGATYGADGELVGDMCMGVARWTQAFDADGNVVDEAYFNDQNQPAIGFEGYSRETRVYDAQGRVTERSWYIGEALVVTEFGAARLAYEYDIEGNPTGETYFGIDGEPMLHALDGIGQWTREYDASGRVTDEAYYGTEGDLMLHPDRGIAAVTYRYDAEDRSIETAWYGTDNELMVHPEHGFARRERTYENDNRTQVAYFGEENESMVHSDFGYARAEASFDAFGDILSLAMYDPTGSPVGPSLLDTQVCEGTCCWCSP